MANINGITMKTFTTYRGHEGESLAQATIYAGTKKLGFWSQDSWGGGDNYDGKEMYETIKTASTKFKGGIPKTAKYYDVLGDADCFMDVLLRLCEDEKEYKRNAKKGYDRLMVITDGYNCIKYGCRGVNTAEEFEKRWADVVTKAKKQMYKNETIKTYMFTSLDDFNITVDKKHPAKEWMYK